MKKWLILGVLLAAGALISCGVPDVGFKQYYYVNLEPDMLGFEIDNTGLIKVVGNKAQVVVSAGAPGGVLERIELQYLQGNGQEIIPNNSTFAANFPVPIPAGVVCPEIEDPLQCTKDAAGWKYGWARSEEFDMTLDGVIAAETYNAYIANAPHVNWHARVVFYARTSNGKPITWEQDIKITFPLAAQ